MFSEIFQDVSIVSMVVFDSLPTLNFSYVARTSANQPFAV